jgi:peptidylprolyl isomerase
MPHKLKTSARRSRRNRKLFLLIGVLAAIAAIIGAIFVFGLPGSNNNNNSGSSQPVKVLLQTTMGNITIQLRDDMPITTSNFRNLVQQGKYDGTIFHRVINGFMIQGGMMNSSIPTIADEFGNNNHNIKGTVAMAKTSQPNSATSQFFINVVDNSNRYATFDTTYSVFGDVIQGMDVAEAISLVQRDSNDKPLIDVQIIKAEILP